MRDTYRTRVWGRATPERRDSAAFRAFGAGGWTTRKALCHFDPGCLNGWFSRPCTGLITLILFDGVSVQYGAGRQILRDVTFTLAPGSFHFVVGRSGAGKSSLLKVMYLGLPPTAGTVSLFGKDVATLDRAEMPALRRRIGVVFQ